MIDIRGFIIRNKKLFSALGMILVVALIFWAVNSPTIVGASATERLLPIYNVQREDKVVAMSFDAGWGNEDTQELIDILNKYKINTTFFLVGDWVDKYPESVKALSDAGNELMNHSSTHAHFSKLTEDQIIADVNNCNDKIEKITGKRPTLIRCPYGEYDDHVIKAINSIGMTAIQWNVDSLDWKGIEADEIQRRVLDNVEPGSIILFHNAAEHTPEALPGIIESLQSQGYKIVPVSQILLQGEYSIDHRGTMIPK